jgi:hypothetical protein
MQLQLQQQQLLGGFDTTKLIERQMLTVLTMTMTMTMTMTIHHMMDSGVNNHIIWLQHDIPATSST